MYHSVSVWKVACGCLKVAEGVQRLPVVSQQEQDNKLNPLQSLMYQGFMSFVCHFGGLTRSLLKENTCLYDYT